MVSSLNRPYNRSRVKQRTVLVVEDDPRYQTLVTKALREDGYQVMQAALGAQGIDLAVQHNPDVIILDVMLPDINGFEVVERLRTFSSSPIIMMTGRGSDVDRVRGLVSSPVPPGFPAHSAPGLVWAASVVVILTQRCT